MADAPLLRISPPLGFRFSVFFFGGGAAPNPMDFRFKKVSGIGATLSTKAQSEGGQNLYSQKVPERVQYDNLVLERGLSIGSPLAMEFGDAMSLMRFRPYQVLVSLLGEAGLPVSSWLFTNAYPVRWALSGLDAESNAVVIETMEVSYQRMQAMRV